MKEELRMMGLTVSDVDGIHRPHSSALPPVRSEPVFSISRFRSVLVKHGIICPEAIEDAEGFDAERTLEATLAAYDELMEIAPAVATAKAHACN